MKKKKLMIFIFMMITMVITSCKTKPAVEEKPTEEPEVVTTADSEIPQSLLKDAEEARKKASDFDGPAYFPSEWEAVEAKYTEAKNKPKTESKEAIELLNAVIVTYNDIFKRAVPLCAQAWEDEIMAVRDNLINSGFGNTYPEYLANADNIALTALDQYEAEDYYIARDTAAKALDEYETLYVYVRAYSKRQEAIERGFTVYDTENFNKADEIANTAIEKYHSKNNKAAKEYGEEAILRYNLVLTNGWTTYSVERKRSATNERDIAIKNKVNIAVRDNFRDADAAYNRAEDTYNTGNYEDAAVQYTEAEALFAIAGQETERKRQKALETIRIAGERIDESNDNAIEAERLIEGGSR